MGCNHSKAENDVIGSTAASSGKAGKPGTGKDGRRTQRRSDRVTFRDDLTSDLIQHKYVDDISEYLAFEDTIGTGHFGCVKRAISKKSGKEWAVKVVKLSNEVDKDALRNEINILKRLHHPQIVRVIASYEDKEQMYMVMQLCKGKELYDHVYQDKRDFSEDEVRKIIRGLLRAIAFLHSNFITHRDLKLENLLLENGENPSSLKLCDFGLSTRFKRGEKLQKSLGTIDYVAPEVLDGDYNEKCDLWSVGVICYELLTRVSPFHAPTVDETMGKIFDGVLVFDDAVWSKLSPSAITFVKALVKEDVDARLSAEQALAHKWLTDGFKHDGDGTDRLMNDKRLLLTNMLSFSRCRKMKQTALLSVALGISEDHIQQEMAAEVFHSMDKRKTGSVSREEFTEAMVECGISDADASELFTRINQSKTGRMNFLEFIAAVMDQRDIGQNTIKEAFGLLDGEKNGRISIVGLRDVFKHSLMPEEVKEMIQSADTKGDGFVDFDEFKDMFAQPTTPLHRVEEISEAASDSDSDLRAQMTFGSDAGSSVRTTEPEDGHLSPTQVHVEMAVTAAATAVPVPMTAPRAPAQATITTVDPVKPAAVPQEAPAPTATSTADS